MRFKDAFASQRPWVILAECIGLTMLIGLGDYLTSWELSLFIFYGIPVFIAGWYCDRRSGIALSAFAGVIWYAANLPTHPYQTHEGYLWAGVNRLFYFVFVAVGATAMRARIEGLTLARNLEQEIVRAGEREQLRIGQDLHDGVCQNLAAIDCATECLREELEEAGLPQTATAGMIQKLLKETIIEARNLARGVFPIQVETDGLGSAIRQAVNHRNVLREGDISFESHGEIDVKDTQVAMHIYRIAQEAVSNAVRHSGAKSIRVILSQRGPLVELTVSDDGRGFESVGGGSGGIGLRTMRYRAQLIGAILDITNKSDGGTTVQCTVRLAESGTSPNLRLL